MAEQQDWFAQNAPKKDDWFAQNAPGASASSSSMPTDPQANSPGAFKRFAQGIGVPTTKQELKDAVTPTDETGPEFAASTFGGVGGKMLYNYGKNLWDSAKKAGGEIFQAGQEAGQTGQYKVPATNAALSAIEFLNRGVLAPVGGNTWQTTAEDIADPTKSKGAVGGDIAADVVNTLMLKSPKDTTLPPPKPAGPGTLRQMARTLVGANDRKVIKKVSEIADKAAKKAEYVTERNKTNVEGTLKDRGVVDEANASQMKDHVADVQSVNEANQALLDQHATDTAAVRQANLEHVRANSQRLAQERELSDVSGQLQDAYTEAKQNGAAANSDQWAKVREKMGGGDKPIDPTGAHQALTDARKTITTPEEARQFDEVLQSEMTPEELQEDQALGANYDALSPDYKAHVDKMTSEALPALAGIAADGSEPMTFNKLHGIYSELGTKLSRGGLSGQTYFGLKKLRESIGGMMETEAQKAGALGDLKAARKGHQQYTETFRDSPNEKATVASKSLQELTPDFIKQQQRADRLRKVSRYNDAIPELANRALELQESIPKLPDAEQLARRLKPEPAAPELKAVPEPPVPNEYREPRPNRAIEQPPVDTQKIREDLIKATANRWAETSQYQIRRLAASAVGGMLAAMFGHGEAGGLVASGYALTEMAPKVAAAYIDRPKILKWLADGPVGDINALNSIPNIDKVKIVDQLTNIAVDEAKAGRLPKISKDMVHLLGPGRMATIATAMAKGKVAPEESNQNLPANAADAKNRVKAVQGVQP